MKLLRVLGAAAVVVVLLLVVGVALAFVPGVQTALVRSGLANRTGPKVELGRVAAGLGRIDVSDLRVDAGAAVLTMPTLSIEVPVIAAARGRIDVRRLVARGWILDFSSRGLPAPAAVAASGSGPATARATFDGIFGALDLPVDLSLAEVELEGDIVTRDASGKPARAHVHCFGGGLGAGAEGRFTIEVDARAATQEATFSTLGVRGSVTVRMNTPRVIDRITAMLDADARGEKVPDGAKLRAEIEMERPAAEGGERYALTLKSIAAAAPKDLIELRAANTKGAANLTGTWKLDIRDADLAPFVLGATLPGFAATGEGVVEAGRSFESVRASGQIRGALEKLEVLKKEFAAMGRISVRTQFDLVQRRDRISVNLLSAEVGNGSPVLTVHAMQAFDYDVGTGALHAFDGKADLVGIELPGLPLAWVQPFLGDVAIDGDAVWGDLVLRAHEGGVSLRSLHPWVLSRLLVVQAGKTLCKGVDLSFHTTADAVAAGWQFSVSEFVARAGGAELAALTMKAGRAAGDAQPVKATGHVRVGLGAMLDQPAWRGLVALKSGRLEGDFTASVAADKTQVAAQMAGRELVAAGGEGLPEVSADLRADLHSDGRVDWELPLVFSHKGRVSDLAIAGGLIRRGGETVIDARVTGNAVYVDDLRVLLALSPPDGEKAGGAAPKPGAQPVADTQPLWSGIGGELKLALKKVVYAGDAQVTDVTGGIKIGPQTLTLENLRAILGAESEGTAAGTVKFEGAKPDPYAYDLQVEAKNFNPAPVLRATAPNTPPTVEGNFDVTGKVTGRSRSLVAAAEQANADLRLTSRGGKFHGFAAMGGKFDLNKFSQGASRLANVLGMAAAALGKDSLASDIEKGRAVVDVIRRLIDIPFDQLNFELVHRPGEATQIREFSLISPDLRLIASGSIGNVSALSLYDRPLKLDTQMSVRGQQASDMKFAGMLKEESDNLGYVQLADKFQLDGTIRNLGTSSLARLIERYWPAPR